MAKEKKDKAKDKAKKEHTPDVLPKNGKRFKKIKIKGGEVGDRDDGILMRWYDGQDDQASFVPKDINNRHWEEYKQWLLDGNTEDPSD